MTEGRLLKTVLPGAMYRRFIIFSAMLDESEEERNYI